jgi:methylated-DNA-[protein]-cysteine S-methyltransferase
VRLSAALEVVNEAMSRRRTDDIRFAAIDTSLGKVAVAWGDDGVRRIEIAERNRTGCVAKLERALGEIREAKPTPEIARLLRSIERHLQGEPARFESTSIDWRGLSPFRVAVYRALRGVAPGETVSYGELAKRVGVPGAARAIGRAMATNPFPLLVPCHRVLASDGSTGGFSAPGGNTTKAKLLSIEGVELARTTGRRFFDGDGALPFDRAQARRTLARADRELSAWMKQVGPLRLQIHRPSSTFAALAESIVYQQLNGRAAATIFARVTALFGKRSRLSAEDVAAASDERLRSAGLSRAKAAALRDLADKTLAGEVPSLARLAHMEDEAIVDALTPIRGIGRWTVQMLLMFKLGRPDVLPIDDYGLRKGFARVFGLDDLPKPAEVAARGERWRPFRTAASWYLWRATDD